MRLFRCLALLLTGRPCGIRRRSLPGGTGGVPPGRRCRAVQPAGAGRLGHRRTAAGQRRPARHRARQPARQAQPGQRLHRAAAQGLAPGHRRDPGEDRPQRRPGTGSSFPGGRYADPQPGALRRHGGRFLGQSLRRRRFPRRQPAHQAGHAAEEWRTDLSRPSEPGHPDQGGAGRRPSRRPNPMEMEEQQAPADAPPVEGGFDAAPPAQ